jgi:hypothetical protein
MKKFDVRLMVAFVMAGVLPAIMIIVLMIR